MGTMTPLSNRDCAALLREWGFEETGYKGGHLVMELDGRRVQITAPARATPTPYRALRKAAKILGITLQEFLAGPKKPSVRKVPSFDIHDLVEKEEEVSIIDVEEPIGAVEFLEPPMPNLFTCPECGKSDFVSVRGFKGHLRAHEQVLCSTCGKMFSRQGIGPHGAACGPKKRGPGRPRRPIAEALEGGRKSKKDLGVELPVLDGYEDDEPFPEPEAFQNRQPGQREATLVLVFEALMPGVPLTDEKYTAFSAWMQATKDLLASS